jgi:hypothetical protein
MRGRGGEFIYKCEFGDFTKTNRIDENYEKGLVLPDNLLPTEKRQVVFDGNGIPIPPKFRGTLFTPSPQTIGETENP